MIPKTIHYCWFGPHPLPAATQRYLSTWRACLPDYTLRLWNESNFDVSQYAYTAQAYAAGKYAFVADVCRVKALYEEGGIYLDTDIEVVRSFDPFLSETCFTGFEEGLNPYTRETTCSPQAGAMGAVAGSAFMHEVLQRYQTLHFDAAKPVTINAVFKELYAQCGIVLNDQKQSRSGYLTVYPSDYFIAQNAYTHALNVTANTVCIHHYDGSWLNDGQTCDALKRRVIAVLRTILGGQRTQTLVRWLKRR